MTKKLSILILVLSLAISSAALAANKKRAPAKKPVAQTTVVSGTEKSVSTEKSYKPSIFSQKKIDIEPMFGFSFINPKDINDFIHDVSDAYQKGGAKSFSMDDIKTSTNLGVAATYRVTDKFATGLGFSHLANTQEGSANVGGTNMSSTVGVTASLLTLEARILLYKENKLDILASPHAGIGFFGADVENRGGASSRISASATGLVLGTTAGARYWFMDNLAAGFYAGFNMAKSGNLKVDSQQNAGQTVGKELDNGGKKYKVDASGFNLATQLTWNL